MSVLLRILLKNSVIVVYYLQRRLFGIIDLCEVPKNVNKEEG